MQREAQETLQEGGDADGDQRVFVLAARPENYDPDQGLGETGPGGGRLDDPRAQARLAELDGRGIEAGPGTVHDAPFLGAHSSGQVTGSTVKL
jgi:hypothetical protein